MLCEYKYANTHARTSIHTHTHTHTHTPTPHIQMHVYTNFVGMPQIKLHRSPLMNHLSFSASADTAMCHKAHCWSREYKIILIGRNTWHP